MPDPDARAESGPGAVRGFRLSVVEGPARGLVWTSTADRCSIGSHAGNHLTLDDRTVSRFHCEIVIDNEGARARDLKSRNGTTLDGVSIVEAFLRVGSLLRIGKSVIQFDLLTETNRVPISEATQFGSLTGVSTPMRAAFAMLERAAKSDSTVLLEGESGTGKSHAALSIHRHSARRDGPFVVTDCGAILDSLLESELFGHERGSFTGAIERRIGAFEEASGGTLFLDEIGDLPLELQPKLLRAIEAREVRRVGSNAHRPVDVRLIAATNRDLRADVNAGRFRADLYFRLAVVTIELPPLRRRPEDIPAILEDVLASLRAPEEVKQLLRSPEFVARLRRGAWPGNVRELRNHVERCLVLETSSPAPSGAPPLDAGFLVDPTAPYASERERVLLAFERHYLEALLRLHEGKAPRAALASGIERTYFYRLLRRHRLAT